MSNEAKFPVRVVLPIFIGVFLLFNRQSAMADSIGHGWFIVGGLAFILFGLSPIAVSAYQWMKKNWF